MHCGTWVRARRPTLQRRARSRLFQTQGTKGLRSQGAALEERLPLTFQRQHSPHLVPAATQYRRHPTPRQLPRMMVHQQPHSHQKVSILVRHHNRSGLLKCLLADVSECLRAALLQAIGMSLAGVPPSTFPISASTFWSSYVLPARPAQALGTYGLTGTSTTLQCTSSHQ